MDLETKLLTAFRAIEFGAHGVTQPIQLSTTFERAPDGSYPDTYYYTRAGNPNREALEAVLAAAEDGKETAAFASGSAATLAVFQALRTGDHVIAPKLAYYGTQVILKEIFARWGLKFTFVDMHDLDAVQAAVTPKTKLIWVETPSNPMLGITDIEKVALIAHDAGAHLACDNTVGTPVLQNPLSLGCDLVVHSTTKYISGHSDVLGGAVVARESSDYFDNVRLIQTKGGGVPSPFDCWLSLRGMKTMPQRVRAQSETALKIAEFLEGHRLVEACHYPGLTSHPHHELALRQMKAFGGLLSFQVKGHKAEALAVAAKTRFITRATSLGGVESTIEHRASMEAPGGATPENLLRLSVGLESAKDLIEDLEQALDQALE